MCTAELLFHPFDLHSFVYTWLDFGSDVTMRRWTVGQGIHNLANRRKPESQVLQRLVIREHDETLDTCCCNTIAC